VSGGVFVTGVFALFFSLFTVGFTREGPALKGIFKWEAGSSPHSPWDIRG